MPAGRPPLLTPATQAAIIEHIEAGNYRQTACAAVGIHRHTLQNWEKRGLAGDEPYVAFFEALTKAEAKAEIDLLEQIRTAQPGQTGSHGADVWQAKAWMLERRFAARWCARVKQQVAEERDALLDKIKSDPALHQRVAAILTESAEADAKAAH